MKESDWTRRCCDKLEAAGAITIAHVAGKMQANHIPDRTIVTVYGNFFVEFKGAVTRVTDGQRILGERINSRFACCFVYRYPGSLSLCGHVRNVDCLTHPKLFIRYLYELTEAVQSFRITKLSSREPTDDEKP